LNRRLSFAVLLRNLKLLEGGRFTRLKMYSNVVKSRFKRAGNSTIGFSPKRLFPIINLCQTSQLLIGSVRTTLLESIRTLFQNAVF
jgi:hypothetical protein